MSAEVSWQVVLRLTPGKLDDFRTLTNEMVEATKDEPGALVYERFISDDEETVWVYERYRNSEAAVEHLKKFASLFGPRFSTMVTRERFTVFGSPSNELREILDGMDATYLDHLAGFSRT